MTSYLNFFKEFLQRKDCSKSGSGSLDDDDYDQQTAFDTSSGNSGALKTIVVGGSGGGGSITTSGPPPASGGVSGGGSSGSKMEHSYTRDKTRPSADVITGLTPARTILVRRTPPCPSCHTHPLEEHDLEDCNQALIPTYNEIAAKEAMNECARIAKYVKNTHADDDDWESKVEQNGWTSMQRTLFSKVVRILDSDQLGRLANAGRQSEAMQRRAIVDKSAARMRKTLASVAWDARLTQWLHCLLMDTLPATYMASYLDVLQTLKGKLPVLMDKMLFARPLNVSQELLAPVMKRQWEPAVLGATSRKLAQEAVIVALPSMPTSGPVPKRLQKWYQHMATITQIVQITLPMTNGQTTRQPLELVAEQIVSLTRVKIQELRNDNLQRSIILIGFNAGAALALQVAMSENIACVVCMGFAYNTFNGVRGMPDDRLLDIKVPILFVIGQNSARTSAEEIEALREKMQSETSLVVVGSADDVLRIPKSRRRIENVTQAMVDTMVVDELFDFVQRTLNNPPGPRIPTAVTSAVHSKHNKSVTNSGGVSVAGSGGAIAGTPLQRKRKQDGVGIGDDAVPTKTKFVPHNPQDPQAGEAPQAPALTANQAAKPKKAKIHDPFQVKRKVGRPRTRPLPSAATKAPAGGVTLASGGVKTQKTVLSPSTITNEDLNLAIQSILNDKGDSPSPTAAQQSHADAGTPPKIVTNFELLAAQSTTPKGAPLKSALITPLHKTTAGGILSAAASAVSGAPTKIKMIPANQFVQLKPPLQSQSKIYTIKTTSMLNHQPGGQSVAGASIGSIVSTSASPSGGVATTAAGAPQQQIFTLKSASGQTTQFVTAAPAGAQQKYTVVKNAAGGTSVQLTKVGGGVVGVGMASGVAAKPQLDLANIIDMPILFADGEGNLSDSMSSEAAKTPTRMAVTCSPGVVVKSGTSAGSGVGQLIISQKIIKEATTSTAGSTTAGIATTKGGTYIISKPVGTATTTILQTVGGGGTPTITAPALGKANKVVFINRNTMKPCSNIIARSTVPPQLSKYAKVVVTNPKTSATTLVPRPTTTGVGVAVGLGNAATATPLVSTVKQVNLQALNAGGGATPLQAGVLSMGTKSFQIVNAGEKPQIRNIMVKSSGLRQIPANLTTQLLNRNLTVRKLVSIVPPKGVAAASVTITPTAGPITGTEASTSASTSPSSSSSAIQSLPKIITLNPVNPSSVVTAASASSSPTAMEAMENDDD